MAMQSASERSWPCDSSSARRCRLLPPRLLGDFWFISKRIICTHCSIACADKHGSCRYISSADFRISAGREQGMLWNALSMRVYANSKAPCSKPPPSPQCFFFQGFFLQSFFLSKLFVRSLLKDIKGSRNQTSCCETLTRRNLSATKSATYVHLVFPKIFGAAVRREALLDNKKTDSKQNLKTKKA